MKRRMSFNQKCLFALCLSILLVGIVYTVIGGLLVGNRAAADAAIARVLADANASFSAGAFEGTFQLVFGLFDVAVSALGLWGALRPRHARPFLVITGVVGVVDLVACASLVAGGQFGLSGVRSLVVVATFFGFALAVFREGRRPVAP